jgi:hypothetical protein
VAGQGTSDEGEPDRAGQQPVGKVRQGPPDGQVLAVVDVEGGQPGRLLLACQIEMPEA